MVIRMEDGRPVFCCAEKLFVFLCSLKVLGAGCGGLWFGVNVFQGVHDQAEGQVSHVLGDSPVSESSQV